MKSIASRPRCLMKGCHYWLTSSARYPLGNRGSDIHPRLVLWIHIHLCRDRHAILRAGSSDNASKPKERRLRKRPKEREGSSTSRHPSCQRSGGSPGHHTATRNHGLHSILPPRQYPPQNNPNRFRAMLPGRTLQRIGRKYHRCLRVPQTKCHRARILPQSHPSRRIIWVYGATSRYNSQTRQP